MRMKRARRTVNTYEGVTFTAGNSVTGEWIECDSWQVIADHLAAWVIQNGLDNRQLLTVKLNADPTGRV